VAFPDSKMVAVSGGNGAKGTLKLFDVIGGK
jgi:hypothetical protein